MISVYILFLHIQLLLKTKFTSLNTSRCPHPKVIMCFFQTSILAFNPHPPKVKFPCLTSCFPTIKLTRHFIVLECFLHILFDTSQPVMIHICNLVCSINIWVLRMICQHFIILDCLTQLIWLVIMRKFRGSPPLMHLCKFVMITGRVYFPPKRTCFQFVHDGICSSFKVCQGSLTCSKYTIVCRCQWTVHDFFLLAFLPSTIVAIAIAIVVFGAFGVAIAANNDTICMFIIQGEPTRMKLSQRLFRNQFGRFTPRRSRNRVPIPQCHGSLNITIHGTHMP
mmetsp:Transcript_8198/g.12408  ORF Transcript_8198/g.12408 Transcript_8198/m.12408 type:complete len:280 (+) Transcript_8198:2304-3143(+)